MIRPVLISIMLFASASIAFAESDEEIVERVHASQQKIFLDQASWALPESFWNSGLSESDQKKIVKKLAEDSASCFVEAIVAYAEQTQKPLSELVSKDNAVGFQGESDSSYFLQLYEPCLLVAWEAAGVSNALGLSQ